MTNEVSDADIQLVLDGFKNIFSGAISPEQFSIAAMKNFMEPIFEQAGYRKPSNGTINNILLMHEAAVGDFIAISPVIREVRRAYPNAHITLIVEKGSANLAEFCPYIDELISSEFLSAYHSFALTWFTNLNIASNLLRRRFDVALAFAYSKTPNVPLLAYMSGARERVSQNSDSMWKKLLTTLIVPKDLKANVVDIMILFAEFLIKKRVSNRELEAWVDDADVESVRVLLPTSRRLYALCVGGTRPKKHYPPESYAQMMNMIAQEDDALTFVLIGGKTDVEEAARIRKLVEPNRVIDLAGKLTFRQTTAALSFCELYIGNDTAPMHLAAAVGIPILSPNCFPRDLKVQSNVVNYWHPYGVPSVIVCPSHALPECADSTNFYGCQAEEPHCITQITPQHLFDAYKVLLKRIDEGINQPLLFDTEKGEFA